MRYILIALLLSGCSTTVPVTAKFPEAPVEANKACVSLKTLNTNAKLSDVAENVTENYSLYYECAIKVDAWMEWHRTQKSIFESVK